MRWAVAGVLFIAGTVGAHASSFDDFNTGVAQRNHNEYATAITYLSRALAAPDLPAHLREPALLARGLAYRSVKNNAAAEADFTAAIALSPNLLTGYMFRADTYETLGKYDAAIGDYSAVIAIKPFLVDAYPERATDYEILLGKYPAAESDFAFYVSIETENTLGFFSLAFSQWLQGHNDKAIANFEQSLSVDKTNAYAALWREIAIRSTGTESDLRHDARRLDDDKWPRPVIDLFLGKAKPEDVTAAAAKGSDADTIKTQQCEAIFYTGEWQLAQKNTAAAQALFTQAAPACTSGENLVERLGAQTELAWLKAAPVASPAPVAPPVAAPTTPVAAATSGKP